MSNKIIMFFFLKVVLGCHLSSLQGSPWQLLQLKESQRDWFKVKTRFTGKDPMASQIVKKKMRAGLDILCKSLQIISHGMLFLWGPQGKKNRGQLRNSWRRDVARKTKGPGVTWREQGSWTQNRMQWKTQMACALQGVMGIDKSIGLLFIPSTYLYSCDFK